MTMYITVATTERVVQASDRQITVFNGHRLQVRDDSTNKSIVVHNHIGFFSIVYAGLAEINKVSTDNIIVDIFRSINPISSSPKILFEKFADLLTENLLISSIPISHEYLKRVSVSASGFLNNGNLFWVRISNFEDAKGCRGELKNSFSVFPRLIDTPTYKDIKHGVYVEVGGIDDNHAHKLMSGSIQQLKRSRFFHRVTGDTVANKLVEIIRNYANSPQSRKLVGHNCMTTILNSPPKINHSFNYHTIGEAPVKYGPHFVFGDSSATDFRAGSLS